MNDERVMDLIVDIYNNMNDEDKAGFTLEAAKEMVKDQIEIDFSQGREPLEYDPQLFYEVIRGPYRCAEFKQKERLCCGWKHSLKRFRSWSRTARS